MPVNAGKLEQNSVLEKIRSQHLQGNNIMGSQKECLRTSAVVNSSFVSRATTNSAIVRLFTEGIGFFFSPSPDFPHSPLGNSICEWFIHKRTQAAPLTNSFWVEDNDTQELLMAHQAILVVGSDLPRNKWNKQPVAFLPSWFFVSL